MCGHQSVPVWQPSFLCQRFLGDFSKGLLVDDEAEEAITRFQEELQEISETIKTRNRGLQWPYIHLLPERVPNGITIWITALKWSNVKSAALKIWKAYFLEAHKLFSKTELINPLETALWPQVSY